MSQEQEGTAVPAAGAAGTDGAEAERDRPHPREITDETLRTLSQYTEHLVALSETISAELREPDAKPAEKIAGDPFQRLLEGIELIFETVAYAKVLLGVDSVEAVTRAEGATTVALQALLGAIEQGRTEDAAGILDGTLRASLISWNEAALPALIRARDC